MTETLQNVIPPQHAKEFILAGKATMGFHSLKTGNTLWYYVKQASDKPGLWYVMLEWRTATKEENSNLGVLKILPAMSSSTMEPVTVNYWPPYHSAEKPLSPLKKEYSTAFAVVWEMLQRESYHPQVVILHRGQCGYCGRPLTDAQSLLTGLGPICRKKLGI